MTLAARCEDDDLDWDTERSNEEQLELDEIEADLDPLEGFLQESTRLSADAFSLEDLLSESMGLKEQHEAERELRKKQARGNLPKAEYDANAALLRKWELKREWEATANVLVFQRQRCGTCGSYHNFFEGKFELHTHRRLANTTRTILVKFHDKALPKEVRYTDTDTHICHACADIQDDWELEDDSQDEVVRVFKSQEELNEENLERIQLLQKNLFETLGDDDEEE